MKKISYITLAIVLLFGIVGTAQAAGEKYRVYEVFLGAGESGTTNDKSAFTSGNTTAASGTSNLYIAGMGTKRSESITYFSVKDSNINCLIVEISAVTASQSAMGAASKNYSGTTFEFGYIPFVNDVNVSKAEKIPMFMGEALSSAVTTVQRMIAIQPTMNIGFYVKSGVTPLDGLNATVAIMNLPDLSDAYSIWISGVTCTVHSTSGVSTLTVPDGARRATLMSLANGIYYTFSAQETPSSQTKQLTAVSLLTMSAQEARKFRFIGDNAADSGVRVDFFTR